MQFDIVGVVVEMQIMVIVALYKSSNWKVAQNRRSRAHYVIVDNLGFINFNKISDESISPCCTQDVESIVCISVVKTYMIMMSG